MGENESPPGIRHPPWTCYPLVKTPNVENAAVGALNAGPFAWLAMGIAGADDAGPLPSLSRSLSPFIARPGGSYRPR